MDILTKLPDPPRAGGDEAGLITPKAWNALVDYCLALAKRQDQMLPMDSPDIAMTMESGGFKARLKRRVANIDHIGAFTPFFGLNPATSGSYLCTVSLGSIYDHLTASGNCILPYAVPNQLTDGLLTRFDIMTGQVVYVHYHTDANGAVIGDGPYPPEIHIAYPTPASTHFSPPVEADAGSAGEYYIPLAKFVVEANGTFTITPYEQGDNISHFRELPKFHSTGSGATGARVFTKYNLTSGQYDYKQIKGIAPIVVEETGAGGAEMIQVRMQDGYPDLTGGGTGKLTVLFYGTTDAEEVMAWANGIVTTNGWINLTLSAAGDIISVDHLAMP